MNDDQPPAGTPQRHVTGRAGRSGAHLDSLTEVAWAKQRSVQLDEAVSTARTFALGMLEEHFGLRFVRTPRLVVRRMAHGRGRGDRRALDCSVRRLTDQARVGGWQTIEVPLHRLEPDIEALLRAFDVDHNYGRALASVPKLVADAIGFVAGGVEVLAERKVELPVLRDTLRLLASAGPQTDHAAPLDAYELTVTG